jgi:hypothetical protein
LDPLPGVRSEENREREHMKTDKAEKILQMIKRNDRQIMKHWKPYDGPPDRDFAVLNAPKKDLEEGTDEGMEVSNVCEHSGPDPQ